MRVGKSVTRAIDEMAAGDLEPAMLHACNAVDGTALKLHPGIRNRDRFTRTLRDNYAILGPMGLPGINLTASHFRVPGAGRGHGGEWPDIADILYGIHRCAHGHGDELPDGFDLIADAAGPPGRTRITIAGGTIRLSDRIIFGMVAVAVMSPVNRDQIAPEDYYLTFGSSATMMINDWWGRAADFPAISALEPLPSIILELTGEGD